MCLRIIKEWWLENLIITYILGCTSLQVQLRWEPRLGKQKSILSEHFIKVCGAIRKL